MHTFHFFFFIKTYCKSYANKGVFFTTELAQMQNMPYFHLLCHINRLELFQCTWPRGSSGLCCKASMCWSARTTLRLSVSYINRQGGLRSRRILGLQLARHLVLWSGVRRGSNRWAPSALQESSCSWRTLTSAHVPWRIATPSPNNPELTVYSYFYDCKPLSSNSIKL